MATTSKIFDQTNVKKILKDLQLLGLSEKEAKVYFSLLPRHDAGSSKIVQASGLHKQFVYNALAKLEELGLARHVIQNGRKKFSAVTPKRLLSLVEEKKLTAQTTAQALQAWFSGAHEQDFEVIQGVNAFAAYQLALLERTQKNSVANVITGPTEKYLSVMTEGGVSEEFEKLRIEKNISVRYLGSPSEREKLKERETWQKLWEYKIFPGLSTGLVDIDIWPDCVVLNIFGNPLLSFVILSKEVSDGYREFFDALWEVSKK